MLRLVTNIVSQLPANSVGKRPQETFSEKSLCRRIYASIAHGDGRGWRHNGDAAASADAVPTAAPPTR